MVGVLAPVVAEGGVFLAVDGTEAQEFAAGGPIPGDLEKATGYLAASLGAQMLQCPAHGSVPVPRASQLSGLAGIAGGAPAAVGCPGLQVGQMIEAAAAELVERRATPDYPEFLQGAGADVEVLCGRDRGDITGMRHQCPPSLRRITA